MADRETHVANYFETKLTAELGPTDLVAEVLSTGGLQSPAILAIEPDNPNQREVILFDGAFTDTEFRATSIANRYLEGSAQPGGLTHPAGSVVRSTPLAQHIQDLNDRIDADRLRITSLEGATVGTEKLEDGAVTNPKIADGAVTAAKIASGAVTTAEIASGAVTATKIADQAVTTRTIRDGHVSTSKIAGNAISAFERSGYAYETSVAVPSSIGTLATVTLNIPSDWSSWDCVAFAHASAGLSSGTPADITLRIDIDENTGPSFGYHVPTSDPVAAVASWFYSDLDTTGNRTIRLRGYRDGAGVNLRLIFLYARAFRTS